ncbi:Inositol-pentakisphosphate 2-kinase [Rhizina undulata]
MEPPKITIDPTPTPTTPNTGRILDDPDDWEYFCEGANNVLYRYIGDDKYYRTFLLRLRKCLPSSPTTLELHSHLQTHFAPLLTTFLMQADLISLGPSLIPGLNKDLSDNHANPTTDWAGRPIDNVKKRRLLDDTEKWGLLVEDMSCGNYLYPKTSEELEALGGDLDEEWKDMAMIEFKPKWLSQSPNSPANWHLCRTCAVREMQKAAARARNGWSEGEEDEEGGDEEKVPEYCPLDLSSGNAARIEQAVFAIVNMENSVMIADPGSSSSEDEMDVDSDPDEHDSDAPVSRHEINKDLASSLANSLVTLLTNFFRTSPIIPLLTSLQSKFGAKGVFTTATLSLLNESDALPSEHDLLRSSRLSGLKIAGARPSSRKNSLLAPPPNEGEGGEENIWTAMTLRDCSLFVKIWIRRRRGKRMEARIECKIGDLDLKGGEGGRAVYWRDVERKLRLGGWYMGRGITRNCRTGQY